MKASLRSRLLLLAQDVLLLLLFLEFCHLGPFLLRLRLLGQDLCLQPFGLHLVDGLHKHPLVLVGITLCMPVKIVINMLVNLLLLPVLPEQTTKYPLASHPKDFGGHASFAGATTFADACVSPFTLPC